MRGRIEAVSGKMFREPEGLMSGLVSLGVSAGSVLAWVSIDVIIGGSTESPSPFLVILAVPFGLLGVAESLPSSRRRLAGTLRTIAVSIPIAALIYLTVVPEFYLS